MKVNIAKVTLASGTLIGAIIGAVVLKVYLGRSFGMGDNIDVLVLGALLGGAIAYKMTIYFLCRRAVVTEPDVQDRE